jgi:thiamine pyrophosphokinase
MIIFANGVIGDPVAARESIHPDDILIAADGGAKNCLRLGFSPHAVIGDQDSLEGADFEALEESGTRFVLYPRDKDQTDLELALRFAVESGAEEIRLLGLLGGRLDQTLANLLLLSLPDWGEVQLTVQDGEDTAHILRGGDSLELLGQLGDIVSLIPLSPFAVGVTTTGLRWPLHNADLSFGSTLGISNEMLAPRSRVRLAEGNLLVVHRKGTSGERKEGADD